MATSRGIHRTSRRGGVAGRWHSHPPRSDMTTQDFIARDRSLNGNHTPACALPTRGGVCDCWPPPTSSAPLGQPNRSSTYESGEDSANRLGSRLVA